MDYAAIPAGQKTKARDILAAIHVLKEIEHQARLPTTEDRRALSRFGGFGPVAISIFPDPVSGQFKDSSWEALAPS